VDKFEEWLLHFVASEALEDRHHKLPKWMKTSMGLCQGSGIWTHGLHIAYFQEIKCIDSEVYKMTAAQRLKVWLRIQTLGFKGELAYKAAFRVSKVVGKFLR